MAKEKEELTFEEKIKLLEEIVKELDSIRESGMLFFAPKTLDYLKKSGRVSVATAIIGNILNLVPVFSFPDGEAHL